MFGEAEGKDAWVTLSHDNFCQLVNHTMLQQNIVHTEKVNTFGGDHYDEVFRFQFCVKFLDNLGEDNFRILIFL